MLWCTLALEDQTDLGLPAVPFMVPRGGDIRSGSHSPLSHASSSTIKKWHTVHTAKKIPQTSQALSFSETQTFQNEILMAQGGLIEIVCRT